MLASGESKVEMEIDTRKFSDFTLKAATEMK